MYIVKQIRTGGGTLQIMRLHGVEDCKYAVVEVTGKPNFTAPELHEAGLEFIAFAARMNGRVKG